MTKESSIYNKDYFETGVQKGISGYQDYRWLPERTIKFAHRIVKELGLREGDKVLDYGCAKGYLVKALRILDIEAFGCDISKYAISEVDKDMKDYCKLMENGNMPFDYNFREVIAKDVFEHFNESQLEEVLQKCSKISERLFAIVPLGEKGKYIIPAYEMDITHNLREPREWWEQRFEENGWDVNRFSYLVKGMKENWKDYPKGNGFFFLKRK